MGSARCSAKSTWGRRSQQRPSSRLSPRKQSRTSSESLLVCGEPREEASRVLLQFLLLLLDHSLPRNIRVVLYRLAGGYVVIHGLLVSRRSARAMICTPHLFRREN